jgi:serine phosphatase RsbU (regulator of sigma subunit)
VTRTTDAPPARTAGDAAALATEAQTLRSIGARLGVRSFLFLVLSLGSVLPVTLLGFNQAERWSRSEVEATDRQALAAARAAADQVAFAMGGYAHTSESFAAQIATPAMLAPEALMPILDAHVAHHPEFLGAYVADAAGKSILHEYASREFAAGGRDYADRDYYQEILRTGKTAISRVQMGRTTKALSVNVASPTRDASGTLTGFTCSSVDLTRITEQAKGTVRGMVGGRVVIVDSEGHRIADSGHDIALEPQDVSGISVFAALGPGQSELRQGVDYRHERVRGAAVGIDTPLVRWRVVAITPQTIVDAHAGEVRNQTLALSLALVVAALLQSAWLSAWLARPLRALAATADAVRRHERVSLPEGLSRGPREMAQLTHAIAAMIDRMRSHAQDLEALVLARTEQLSHANAGLESALVTIRSNERRIYEDIEQARLFQERMLPVLPGVPALDLAVYYGPLEQVSGDIYDIARISADRVRIFLADVTGHGVQASMRTILLKAAYDRIQPLQANPARLLEALNAHIVNEFPEGDLHCTACCLDIVFGAGAVEVIYANGGNPPLFLFSPGSPVREVYAGGPLLGSELVAWPEPETFRLEPGELMIVCSDGLTEQSDSDRARFEGELSSHRFGSIDGAADAVARLVGAFDTFRGTVRTSDDVTLIAVRVRTAAEI